MQVHCRNWCYSAFFFLYLSSNGNWYVHEMGARTMFQFLPMRLLPNKYVTRQYPGWALDFDCKPSSQFAFCRLGRSAQFTQAAVQADDATTLTISFQRLQYLHDISSFSSLQVPTKIYYRSSQCHCTFIYKYLHVIFRIFQCKCAGYTKCLLSIVISN